jgi:hypothetical protein
MPFFIFKVPGPSSMPVLLEVFHEVRFGEAYAHRLASAQVRNLRRNACPEHGHLFYMIYGYTEGDARRRLAKQLRPKRKRIRPLIRTLKRSA